MDNEQNNSDQEIRPAAAYELSPTESRRDMLLGRPPAMLPVQFNVTNNHLTPRPAGGLVASESEENSHNSPNKSMLNRRSESAAPLSVTIPCGARGMPPDHDSETGYFTIHPATKHGDELVCSHAHCRAGGIKFCYCAHCNMPVAKRNFKVRHHHSNDDGITEPNNNPVEILGHVEASQAGSNNRTDYAAAPAEEVGNRSSQIHLPFAQQEVANRIATIAATHLIQGLAGFPNNPTVQSLQSAGLADASDMESASQRNPVLSAVSSQAAAPEDFRNNASTITGHNLATRFPCRARGMPPEHNAEAAYFDVPHDIKHGDELVCSFPGCRNAGVKFCFCTHCKIPVAKRNFRIRHNHCDFAPPAPSVTEALGSAVLASSLAARDGKARRPNSPNSKKRRGSFDSEESTTSSVREDSGRRRRGGAMAHGIPPLEPKPVTISVQNDSVSEGGGSPVSDDDDEITAERIAAWDRLLEQRPKKLEAREMTSWLMSVLAVSNVEVPVEPTEPPSSNAVAPFQWPLEVKEDSDVDSDLKRSKRPRR